MFQLIETSISERLGWTDRCSGKRREIKQAKDSEPNHFPPLLEWLYEGRQLVALFWNLINKGNGQAWRWLSKTRAVSVPDVSNRPGSSGEIGTSQPQLFFSWSTPWVEAEKSGTENPWFLCFFEPLPLGRGQVTLQKLNWELLPISLNFPVEKLTLVRTLWQFRRRCCTVDTKPSRSLLIHENSYIPPRKRCRQKTQRSLLVPF